MKNIKSIVKVKDQAERRLKIDTFIDEHLEKYWDYARVKQRRSFCKYV